LVGGTLKHVVRSLRAKITFSMWFLVAFCVVATVIISGNLLLRNHRQSVRQQLQATGATLLSLGISDFAELSDFEQFNSFVENALHMERVDKVIRIFDSSQRLIFTTVGLKHDPFPRQLEKKLENPRFLTLNVEKEKYESLIVPYKARGRAYFLQIVIPLPRYSEILFSFWWQSLLFVGFLIIVSLFLSHWLTDRLLEPVRRIAEHLRQMDPMRVEEWKTLEGAEKGEYLGPITKGINLLIEKARASLEQLWKMSRYVAHELRTPLTILRGEAETVLLKSGATKEDYEKVLRSSLEEVQKMSETVTTVLKVGEQEKVLRHFQPKNISLVLWVSENKKHWEKILGREIFIENSLSKENTVFLDPELLFRLVDNLVRNIKEHTPPHTPCQFRLFLENEVLVLQVVDFGPGLTPRILQLLNEKTVEPQALSGIGLHLCRRIAEICRIRLAFLNRPEGGLQATLYFE